jgi:hypothetical protein
MKMWPGSPLAVKLTGLSLEEIVNLLLTDELTCFRPDYVRPLEIERSRKRRANLAVG